MAIHLDFFAQRTRWLSVGIIIFLLLMSAIVNGEWQSECVDCSYTFKSLGPRSIAVDSAGYPHIAYGGNGLLYSWYDGSQWRHQIIDATLEIGNYASLALDSQNNPHFVYCNAYSDKVLYAEWNGTAWQSEVIDITYFPTTISIAMDPFDNPHILYGKYGNGFHAYRDGGEWQYEEITLGGWETLSYQTFDIDQGGTLHFVGILEYPYPGILEYGYRNETGWHFETIGPVASEHCIRVIGDVNGYPHIAYFLELCTVGYAFKDSQGWHTEIAADVYSYCMDLSLAMSADGFPQISFVDYTLKCVLRDNDGWHVSTIDEGESIQPYCSIAISDANTSYISYLVENDTGISSSLKCAILSDSQWRLETVYQSEEIGFFNSIQIDSRGNPHISYQSSNRLKYAYYNGSSWSLEYVDSLENQGSYSALVLDTQDFPHISYLDEWNDDLKYAYKDDSGWHSQTIDSTGAVGWETSLALDGAGYAHIVYFDVSSRSVNYAYQNESGWHTEVIYYLILSSFVYGTSIAVDSNGFPHICFIDDWLPSIKYAYRNASVWQIEPVAILLSHMNRGVSLALDARGNPQIMYSDGELHYAFRSGGVWYEESTGISGEKPSMEIDKSGYPHMSYTTSYSLLGYAYLTSMGWQESEVDNEGESVGYYNSLALDGNEAPHISYFDFSRMDLLYATNSEVPTPAPTPSCTETGSFCNLNSTLFSPGDQFELTVTWRNCENYFCIVDCYLVLEAFGLYFFWNTWEQEVTAVRAALHPRESKEEAILSFVWPDTTDQADNLAFWAVMLVPETSEQVGTISHCEFGYTFQ